ADDEQFDALPERTIPPGTNIRMPSRLFTIAPPVSRPVKPGLTEPGANDVEAEKIIRDLQATLRVFQGASNTQQLFKVAADTVVSMVGLDSARVMLLESAEWRDVPESRSSGPGLIADRPPSKQVLTRVRMEKRTFWQAPGRGPATTDSLMGVTTVVAAPILNKHDE